MNQQTSSTYRPLIVQAKFEPSRLAAACTADAYKSVVPLVQRPPLQKYSSLPAPVFARATCRASRAEGSL